MSSRIPQSKPVGRRYRIGFITRFLDAWPGKNTFGIYRFLPMFFVLGAALEFSMINWQVGQTNFYKTFKQRQAEDILQRDAFREELIRQMRESAIAKSNTSK